jgi:hypothetical protein
MNRRTPKAAACFLVFFMVLAGCGDGRLAAQPVRGRVVCGETPARYALVIFHPQDGPEELQKLRPHGVVEADGSFTLTTYRPGDGAPAGQYRVTIEWPSPLPGETEDDPEHGPSGPDILQGRYADPAATPLSAEVVKGVNNLEPFQVQ